MSLSTRAVPNRACWPAPSGPAARVCSENASLEDPRPGNVTLSGQVLGLRQPYGVPLAGSLPSPAGTPLPSTTRALVPRLQACVILWFGLTGRSSNGKTAASGAAYRGSSPCLPAIPPERLPKMKLLRFAPYAAALCLTSFASAQAPKAAEKSAEAQQAELAVREQAKKFYALLSAGKARAAEALVCEASKDEYYSMTKPTPRSVEVRTVTVADDLKSAKATAWLEDTMSFGLQSKLVKMPVPSQWRPEAGQWCYYLPPAGEDRDTPFGKIKATKAKGGPDANPSEPRPVPANPEKLSNMITFSKLELALPSKSDGKDEIIVSNGVNGPIMFQLACPPVAGLACKMDQEYVSPGKQGKLLLNFTYKGALIQEPLAVTLWVMPFHTVHTFPIRARVETRKP